MRQYSKIKARMQEVLPPEDRIFFEPIKKHTYTKLGGEADIFVTPTTIGQLKAVLEIAKEYHTPVTVMGNGSNLIIKDNGLMGLTINLEHMNEINILHHSIYAQAGAGLIDVSRKALEMKLSGLEFACGIPGTIGGALYMNAGAYGGQVSDVLLRALVMNNEGDLLTLTKDELNMGYRKSLIATGDYIVLEAEFRLEPGIYKEIKDKMDHFTYLRESKQPLEYPSCGSVFKRPEGYYTGKLIQDCGLQGMRIGGAQISTKHAGFIVNVGGATSKDYTDLIRIIQKTVKQRYGVDLETEVIIRGREDQEVS
ncbi:UDP-N-acetylmuramate dehydrogenase [Fictibacillus fluitans]|uniref:UDP-N-acetylenolpyruvoylglucosamine reductase n=1 Tax=Fictibacillus fluitans TaxID=3058422 RepID=A0ABT8I0P7_9BACL|nr:UDP-N-acetylmuramate dehydrogenase [Fictibacillus sp. NE201]MDN4526608.1 UDP-N-acetylmuramate dehydrogenase [Fictibacillus sp. NE201]